jgi:hypothetical protein
MGALKKKCSACKPEDPQSNHRVPPSLAVISVPAETLFQVNLVIHGRTIEKASEWPLSTFEAGQLRAGLWLVRSAVERLECA